MNKILFILFVLCFVSGLHASIFGNAAYNEKSRKAEVYYSEATAQEPHRKQCNNLHNKGAEKVSCERIFNPASEHIDFFLWGDSHTSAMVPGFVKQAELHGLNFRFSVLAGCPGVLNMRRIDTNTNCAFGANRVVEQIESIKPPLVILASSYVRNVVNGNLRSVNERRTVDSSRSRSEFSAGITATVERLKNTGASVVVVTEPPRHRVDPVIETVKEMMIGEHQSITSINIDDHLERIEQTYSYIDDSGIDERLNYSNFFCDISSCITRIDNQSLYKDVSHISNYGSTIVAEHVINDLFTKGFLKESE